MTSRSVDSIGTVSIERARYPVFSSKLRLWRSVFVLGVDSSLVRSGMLIGCFDRTAWPTIDLSSMSSVNSLKSTFTESFCDSMKWRNFFGAGLYSAWLPPSSSTT